MRDDVGVAEQRVRVEIELGVERDDLAVAGEDQRVDLGERRVGLVEQAVEAVEHGARLRQARIGDADLAPDVVGLRVGQPWSPDR